MKLSELLAVPSPVRVDVLGRERHLSPLTLGDFALLEDAADAALAEAAAKKLARLESLGLATPEGKADVAGWAKSLIDAGPPVGWFTGTRRGKATAVALSMGLEESLDKMPYRQISVLFDEVLKLSLPPSDETDPNARTPAAPPSGKVAAGKDSSGS